MRLRTGDEAVILAEPEKNPLPSPGWGLCHDTETEKWNHVGPGDKVRVVSDESREPWGDSIGYGKTTRQTTPKVLDGKQAGRVMKIARDIFSPVGK